MTFALAPHFHFSVPASEHNPNLDSAINIDQISFTLHAAPEEYTIAKEFMGGDGGASIVQI